jgi:UDPglucose--hexose-1-phosphate uridylyltransferase
MSKDLCYSFRMPAFDFLKNPVTKKWTILAPRRAKRPDFTQASSGMPNRSSIESVCPFCPERLAGDEVLYSRPLEDGSKITVVPNKFPFAPIHELVINTPKHDLDLAMLSVEHLKVLLEVYKHRFNEHYHAGQVYIFHNHGEKAGESIPHSHTQIAVLPEKVFLDAPQLSSIEKDLSSALVTDHFMITCPQTSQWPDEVWVAPKARGKIYGEITEVQAADLAHALSSLIRM